MYRTHAATSETTVPSARDARQLTPTVAEISLPNLRHNVRVLQELAESADLMAVVKADAYGHGAERVASVLREEGVRHFAVARVPEAVALRQTGFEERLLVLEAPLPGHLPAYAEYDLEVTIPSRAVAEAAIEVTRTAGPLRVHVKTDTGMGRLGMSPAELPTVVDLLQKEPRITLASLWTHLATADEPGEGLTFAREQLSRFREVLRKVEGAAERVHVANTGALLTLGESLRAFRPSLVRAGIGLYGLASIEPLAREAGLRPAMRFTSRVTHLKTLAAGETVSYGRTWRAEEPTRVATVGAGYADGYFHYLSNRAEVGIGGHRFPVIGSVCMDMFMVNLGPSGETGPGAEVEIGDEVVLFGPGGPSAFEVACWAETIPYEVCCAVSKRVPRYYRDSAN